MSRKRSARCKKLRIPTTIQRVNGALSGKQKSNCKGSPASRENCHQFLGRNNFELAVSTILRPLIRPPSAKLGHVAEARTLHMLVGNLDYKFRPQGFPRKILPLAPAAFASRDALPCWAFFGMIRPFPPRVIQQSVLSIGREVLDQFHALQVGEARANAHVLQCAGIVEKPEQ